MRIMAVVPSREGEEGGADIEGGISERAEDD